MVSHIAMHGMVSIRMPGPVELVILLVVVAVPLLVLGLLIRLLVRRRRDDREIHCRKCNHILRGISEPRCPECGEPI